MRVEQLSVRAGVSVDTIRYYQSKGLVDPPRREGRVAWYGDSHVERIGRVRSLQQRGFTLATIARLLNGELDAADEALVGELTGHPRSHPPSVPKHPDSPNHPAVPNHRRTQYSPDLPRLGAGSHGSDSSDDHPSTNDVDGVELFTLEELAVRTGVPLALLKAVEAEGLLIPRRVGADDRYTDDDVAAGRAGLLLLEWGIPLSALLDLARRHHRATEAVAHEAVELFSTYIRGALRDSPVPEGPAPDSPGDRDGSNAATLVQAYSELLPAIDDLVGHHFTRTLLKTALDHIEQTGTDVERQAVWAQARTAVSSEQSALSHQAAVSGQAALSGRSRGSLS